CAARVLGATEAVSFVSRDPKGTALGWGVRRGGRLVRGGRAVIGRLRRLRRAAPQGDVLGGLRRVWTGRPGAVPADRRSAGLLQRLLPEQALTPVRRPR